MSALEESERVRKKSPALRRESRGSPRSPALAVQLDSELRLECDQPIADSLFCNSECICRSANLTDTRELNEGGDLIRAEMWKSGHVGNNTSNQFMNLIIYNTVECYVSTVKSVTRPSR